MREKVLLLDDIPNDLYQQLQQTYDVFGINDAATCEHRHLFRMALANGESRIGEAEVTPFPRLELLAIYGVGYDGVDREALKKQKITLTHTPDVLTADVAELAIGLMLALARDIPGAHQFVQRGEWQHGRYPLQRRVSGSRVGLVGLGRIGEAIGKRLAAFDCDIHYFSRTDKQISGWHFQPDLCRLAEYADFLIIALSASTENHHLIDAGVLQKLGPGGFLINVARGSLVDEEALIASLQTGAIAGAALDVLAQEPHVPAVLRELQNVIVTPHMGSATGQARAAMTQLVLDNLHCWQSSGKGVTPVG